MTAKPLLAGVELGGTKCVCILGTGPDDIRAEERLPTLAPEVTLARIHAVIDEWRSAHGPVAALGVASFGPLDLNPSSATYGYIRSTTKPAWSHTNLLGSIANTLRVPVRLNTDVNGAALAEGRWGAATGLENFAYITVGTGVGVGLIVNGQPVQGFSHTEMGHVRIARMPGDLWPGACPFHGDCVEGLASGPAIEARTGAPAETLGPEHAAWNTVVHALAQLLHTIVLSTAPERILIGGGVVASRSFLLERVRGELQRSLNRYLQLAELEAGLDQYVAPPGLGTRAGPLGAIALAEDALRAGS